MPQHMRPQHANKKEADPNTKTDAHRQHKTTTTQIQPNTTTPQELQRQEHALLQQHRRQRAASHTPNHKPTTSPPTHHKHPTPAKYPNLIGKLWFVQACAGRCVLQEGCFCRNCNTCAQIFLFCGEWCPIRSDASFPFNSELFGRCVPQAIRKAASRLRSTSSRRGVAGGVEVLRLWAHPGRRLRDAHLDGHRRPPKRPRMAHGPRHDPTLLRPPHLPLASRRSITRSGSSGTGEAQSPRNSDREVNRASKTSKINSVLEAT